MAKPPVCELTIEFLPTFAKYVQRKLKRSRRTLRSFASLVGLSYPLISRLKNGIYHPSRATAKKIGDAFDEPERALLAAGYLPSPDYIPSPNQPIWRKS